MSRKKKRKNGRRIFLVNCARFESRVMTSRSDFICGRCSHSLIPTCIGISDDRPGNLALCSMLVDGGAPAVLDGHAVVSCKLHSIPLFPRVYHLWASVRSEHGYGDVFDWQSVGSFRIADAPGLIGPAAQAHVSTDGAGYIQHDWEMQ